MIAAQSAGALTLWTAASNPDNDVHNTFGIRAALSELFMNTTNSVLFFCAQGGTGTQIWYPLAYANRSQSSAARSLNTIFQVSATRDSQISYSVSIATSITLTAGQSGTIILEMASNSGFTVNVQELSRLTNQNTGTLTIGLALNQTIAGCINGYVPAGYYARLRTVSTTGTPTFTYVSGQEVLF